MAGLRTSDIEKVHSYLHQKQRRVSPQDYVDDGRQGELPEDYPHEAILDALNVVMRNNLAEFGLYQTTSTPRAASEEAKVHLPAYYY
eukprot:scaffold9684_cov147-Skeletonema_dohrnii-CCMP3373.AAC.1